MEIRKLYFENLDALRTISCLIVMFSHMHVKETFSSITDFFFFERLLSFFTDGGVGVSFFFVLSGFLITFLFDKRKRE